MQTIPSDLGSALTLSVVEPQSEPRRRNGVGGTGATRPSVYLGLQDLMLLDTGNRQRVQAKSQRHAQSSR